MPALLTRIGILLILLAIPIGLMRAPSAVGITVVLIAWPHVAAPPHLTVEGARA